MRKPSGEILLPFGEHVAGMLIYTAQGHMSGQLMKREREALPDGYRKHGAKEIITAAFEGYIAYCGTWRYDAEREEVVHTVEASLYPNWVGTEQRRGIRFASPNRMILSAVLPRSDGEWTGVLTWERS